MAADDQTVTVDHRLRVALFAVILYIVASEDHVHAIADSRLSLAKLKLLHILRRPHGRPPRLTRVSQMLGMRSGATSTLVDELDQARLVDRIPDEEDGRVKRVVITPKGREQLERLDHALVRDLDKFIRDLDAERKRGLLRELEPLLERPEIAELRPDVSDRN